MKYPEDFKILIACEESQIVCKEFRKLGFEAFSCDIQKESGGRPEWHIQDKIQHVFGKPGTKYPMFWDLVIAHPPCDYLTNSANKWYKDQPERKSGALVGEARREAREEAIMFFMGFVYANCEHIAIENPIGVMSTRYRKPDQVIQPWMFGHGETKATCLWLTNLPKLIPTNIVSGREQKIFKMSPGPERSKLRSKTYQGVGEAMAKQWGNFLLSDHKLTLEL